MEGAHVLKNIRKEIDKSIIQYRFKITAENGSTVSYFCKGLFVKYEPFIHLLFSLCSHVHFFFFFHFYNGIRSLDQWDFLLCARSCHRTQNTGRRLDDSSWLGNLFHGNQNHEIIINIVDKYEFGYLKLDLGCMYKKKNY